MASSSSNKTSADLYGVEIVVDEKSHKKYKKGKFLGKVWNISFWCDFVRRLLATIFPA